MREQLQREGGVLGKLGASIMNTCVPTGKRRLPVQELAFNKLRFIEVLARSPARLSRMPPMLQRAGRLSPCDCWRPAVSDVLAFSSGPPAL